MTRRWIALAALVCCWPVLAYAQWASVNAGAALPAACRVGDIYIITSPPTLSHCPVANTWATLTLLTPSAAWGQVTGTLSNQTDLQTALNGKISTGGLAGTATTLATPRAINGVNFDGSGAITVTAAAGTLTGATLASGVTASSLTSFGASPTLTTPNIGAATGTSAILTGAITSSGTAGIGYATGAGGTITQLTNKSTTVILNKLTGDITMNGAALAAAAIVSFTVTNSTVAATDNAIVNHVTTGTFGAYQVSVNTFAAGSFKITVKNISAGSLSEAIVIRFTILKGATS